LGYAVLSALESLPQAGVRYEYAGPVISGATIGVWQHVPLESDADKRLVRWRCRQWMIEIPYRQDLPTIDDTKAELAHWQRAEQAANVEGDTKSARDCRAQVERRERQLVRLGQLPRGPRFPLAVTLWQLGDGYWLMVEGEYYQALQRSLRDRFQSAPIIVGTVVNGWRPAYLPTRETYGRGIYQEQVAVLAPGCLETVIDAVASQLAKWHETPVGNSL
jgi:hypothetical protein